MWRYRALPETKMVSIFVLMELALKNANNAPFCHPAAASTRLNRPTRS